MEENLKQITPIIGDNTIIKIVMFGPESTGKTTLSKALAEHFNTAWTPEFARDYLQEKWDATNEICNESDMLPIAIGQTQLENETLLKANRFLFCDTNVLVTKVFSELYYNHCPKYVDKAARKHKYDLFFLTDIDVPWEKDDLRDRPENRLATFELFKTALIENNKPFITLKGDENQRLNQAITITENLEIALQMGFSSYDFIQIYEHGIPLENIKNQLSIFRKGIAKTILDRPATKGDGIVVLNEADFVNYATYFDDKKNQLKLKKFVPASGAASRMFKFLNEFIHDFNVEEETINAYINRKKATSLSVFLVGLDKFPFYDKILLELQKNYSNYKNWSKDLRDFYFIKTLLSPRHFDFANKPKGILPFHSYENYCLTPIEEHLLESVYYSSAKNCSHIHFTVSEEHQLAFEHIIKKSKYDIEQRYNQTINTKFSYQNKITDTLAVDLKNNPFRNENGKLVFRPGGHGALIENLNDLCADIVFIKNIDNVIHNQIEAIALYKKALAGILIELQEQIFSYLKAIDAGAISEKDIEDIVLFAKEKLNIEVGEEFSKYTLANKMIALSSYLNRPIRICGMVKNEGEPGGGPFWVLDKKGNTSLQIVESSQVAIDNKEQEKILKSATHFNPVDLVCGIKDYKGEKFNLKLFIDHNSGFIVEKNKNGKPLKAYELPGLWNGAMAKWITIFVQVPLITFNPVKTVNDLLKAAHQPQ